MRARAVAKQYLKTWFPFDFIVVFVDWTLLYLASIGSSYDPVGVFRFGKTFRVTRILRAFRLLRFVKLQRVLTECLELINSESIRALFNVSMAVAVILIINHYMACGWYMVGRMGVMSGWNNWLKENGIEENEAVYGYMTCLHWSLTQFTPASMEVRPYNAVERVYAIAALLFALITFSSFLGSITAAITQLRKYTSESVRQQHLLRVYFQKNNISASLSKTIWNFLKDNHFAHQTRSHKETVTVLRLLPPHLERRLHQELYGPYVTRAPFFHHFAAVCTDGLIEVCSKAISEKTVICGEELFLEGKVATKMSFIVSGVMRYEHTDVRLYTTIVTGLWVSEPALWLQWAHCAPLVAQTSAEIVELNVAQFRDVVSSYLNALPLVRKYVARFVEYMRSRGDAWNTDVWTNKRILDDIARYAWYDEVSEHPHGAADVNNAIHLPHEGRRWSCISATSSMSSVRNSALGSLLNNSLARRS
jgi:voltage-gated potassium channel